MRVVHPYTAYEATVPATVQRHTEDLMRRWRTEGRNDDEIENIVRAVVLNAYATGVEEERYEQDSALDERVFSEIG